MHDAFDWVKNGLKRAELRAADFDKGLAGTKKLNHLWPTLAEQSLQASVGRVAARQPHDLRRWSVFLEQTDEVAVFAQDDGTSQSGSLEEESSQILTRPGPDG